MINPYAGVSFGSESRINSVSHQHLSHESQSAAQNVFDKLYLSGIRHFPVVQYRPSILSPYDYAADTLRYTLKPIPSNASISTIKTNYQAVVTGHADVIGGPNAEHIYSYLYFNGAWNMWSSVHMNGIGSLYESGLQRVNDSFEHSGTLCPYSEAIQKILDDLKYPNGGGVIINHPKWTMDNTHVPFDMQRFIMDCLDYDPRVLGTDIIEGGSQANMSQASQMIDGILSTGRRCWLFCQDDWLTTSKIAPRGRNELLIPSGLSREQQEQACFKAYRDGAFFGRYANSDLAITSVGYSSGRFTMTTENADGIKVTVDGNTTDYSGNSVSVAVPSSAVYVRAMAYKNRDEDPDWAYKDSDVYKDVVFTNPIMINEKQYRYNPAYDLKKRSRIWLLG